MIIYLLRIIFVCSYFYMLLFHYCIIIYPNLKIFKNGCCSLLFRAYLKSVQDCLCLFGSKLLKSVIKILPKSNSIQTLLLVPLKFFFFVYFSLTIIFIHMFWNFSLQNHFVLEVLCFVFKFSSFPLYLCAPPAYLTGFVYFSVFPYILASWSP